MMPEYSDQFSLQAVHTFGLQAQARRLVDVATEDQLRQVIGDCQTAGQSFFILGEGSNTVFTGDVDATVIRIRIMGRQWLDQPSAGRLRVAAGENWHELVEWTLLQGSPGLENLALIPGSVGACPVQNIGAYGLEVMDRIESVRVLDIRTLQYTELTAAQCGFAYRDSIFKHEWAQRAVITAVTFIFPQPWRPLTDYADISRWLGDRQIDSPVARDIFNAVVAVRTAKLPDPRVMGNAGSFFKNPIVSIDAAQALRGKWPDLVTYPQPDGRVKLAAGWLIDRAGLKGFRMGGAAVSDRQALVLVNRGGATAADLRALVTHVQATVAAVFGVVLEPEPVMMPPVAGDPDGSPISIPSP